MVTPVMVCSSSTCPCTWSGRRWLCSTRTRTRRRGRKVHPQGKPLTAQRSGMPPHERKELERQQRCACLWWIVLFGWLPAPPTTHPLQKKIKLHAKFKRVFILLPHPPIKLHERFKRARVHWRKTILNSKRKMVVKREKGFWTVKGKWQSKERCVSSVHADWLIASVTHSLVMICFVLSHWKKGS